VIEKLPPLLWVAVLLVPEELASVLATSWLVELLGGTFLSLSETLRTIRVYRSFEEG
jgi:hypothetical protein